MPTRSHRPPTSKAILSTGVDVAALTMLQVGVARYTSAGDPIEATPLAQDLLGGHVHLPLLLDSSRQPLDAKAHPLWRCVRGGSSTAVLVGVPSVARIRWVRLRFTPTQGEILCLIQDAEEEHLYREAALGRHDGPTNTDTALGIWGLEAPDQLRCDDTARQILDLPAQATLSDLIARLTPGAQARLRECLKQAFCDGNAWDEPMQLQPAPGRARWVRVLGRVSHTSEDHVCIIGTVSDITPAQAQATERDQALYRAQAFQRLCQGSRDLMAIASRDGTLEIVNDAWTRLLGYPLDEVVGNRFTRFIHPDDAAKTIRERARMAAGGAPLEKFVNRYRHRDGHDVWIEWHSSAEPSGRTYAVGRDITAARAQRREHERLALIAQQAHNALLITDRSGNTEWVNPSFTKMTGYSLAEIVGKRPGDVLLGADIAPQTIQAIRAHAQRAEGFRSEVVFYRRDGTTFWCDLEVHSLYGEDGKVSGFVAMQEDITARKDSESALIQARNDAQHHAAEAQRASAAKSTFLATMSHELRTPMNGVLGTVQVLSMTDLTEQQSTLVETIQASGDALLSILNDILDFSKIEAGRMTLNEAPFALRPLLDGLSALMRPSAQRKGLKLALHVAPGLGSWWRGDALRIQQMLTNLLSNAIKFTDHGRISVSAKAADGALLLGVTDTGIGISADAQARLFQPFTQVDPSATRQYSGTGLGLAICQRLIMLMGGKLWVDSEPGQGSTFWLRLPLAAAAPPLPCPPKATPLATPTLTGQVANLRVLIAEDNAINQLVATRMLSRLGCESVVVSNGAEALEAMSTRDFDAVLMDCHMPVVDGWEASRRRRALEQREALGHMPIIALTANAMRGDREQCIAAGMDDYLSKPVKFEALRAALLRNLPHSGAQPPDDATRMSAQPRDTPT